MPNLRHGGAVPPSGVRTQLGSKIRGRRGRRRSSASAYRGGPGPCRRPANSAPEEARRRPSRRASGTGWPRAVAIPSSLRSHRFLDRDRQHLGDHPNPGAQEHEQERRPSPYARVCAEHLQAAPRPTAISASPVSGNRLVASGARDHAAEAIARRSPEHSGSSSRPEGRRRAVGDLQVQRHVDDDREERERGRGTARRRRSRTPARGTAAAAGSAPARGARATKRQQHDAPAASPAISPSPTRTAPAQARTSSRQVSAGGQQRRAQVVDRARAGARGRRSARRDQASATSADGHVDVEDPAPVSGRRTSRRAAARPRWRRTKTLDEALVASPLARRDELADDRQASVTARRRRGPEARGSAISW